ncbi:hypothetical protein LCGC14_1773910 [marine sediment metagenome]|uniref:Uncharacterized protein n=1 Tax=marine sediment metagenome TaxID=412755 RepID=A0A0F9JX51_9ZZZZ
MYFYFYYEKYNINQQIWNHLCWKRQHLLAISHSFNFKKQELTEIKERTALQSQYNPFRTKYNLYESNKSDKEKKKIK